MQVGELRALIEGGGVADRAFADGVIRMKRGELVTLHPLLVETAARVHGALRARIVDGLRGDELRSIFDAQPEVDGEGRDHFVEEVLGIAYPPLEESTPGPEQIPYLPSGYAEIVHAFDATGLRAGETFFDIGAGLGKAVMLAELLTGATAVGVELDAVLHAEATHAARALGLRSAFTCGDARTAPWPARADVVFMYLPFTGTVLEAVMVRVDALAPRFVCAGTLDRARHPSLHVLGAPRSWLQIYAAGSSSVTDESSDPPTT
ncbi:MAG: hypothetical protein U0270_21095 [Labilithrix sp.]